MHIHVFIRKWQSRHSIHNKPPVRFPTISQPNKNVCKSNKTNVVSYDIWICLVCNNALCGLIYTWYYPQNRFVLVMEQNWRVISEYFVWFVDENVRKLQLIHVCLFTTYEADLWYSYYIIWYFIKYVNDYMHV